MQVPFYSPIPEKTFEDDAITNSKEREKIFGQADHVRKFGKDYVERINRSGLTAEANGFGKSLLPDQVARFAVEPSEILYIGRKRQ